MHDGAQEHARDFDINAELRGAVDFRGRVHAPRRGTYR